MAAMDPTAWPTAKEFHAGVPPTFAMMGRMMKEAKDASSGSPANAAILLIMPSSSRFLCRY
jgi:hypothetical protein